MHSQSRLQVLHYLYFGRCRKLSNTDCFLGEKAKNQEMMISHHEIVADGASLFAVLTRFMPSLTVDGGNL